MEEIALLARLLKEGGVDNVHAITQRCSEAAGKPIDREVVTNWLKHTGRRQ